jgi:thiol-disulfide isomerase/thioredoxin
VTDSPHSTAELLDALGPALHRYRARRRRRLLYGLAALLGAAAVSVALGATYGGWFQSPAPFRPLTAPIPLPRLDGRDLRTGRRIRSAELSGHSGFLVAWASWCQPCAGELAGLQSFETAHPALRIVGLDANDPRTVAARFLEQHRITFPSFGVSMRRLQPLGVVGFPTLFAFNAKGKIVAVAEGYAGRTPTDVLAGEARKLGKR